MTNRRGRKLDLRWLLPAVLLVLGGCSSTEWTRARDRAIEANTTVPTSYRDDILSFMRTYLNNPTGIRGAFVSEPALRTIAGASRYSVCLRYNARNSAGKYAGSKDSVALFRDGRFDHLVDNARGQCKDADYRPFPELERLSR
jgi:hypothetical protein